MTRLFPTQRTPTRRKTGSSVYVVFRGSGHSVINGLRFDWGPGDIFVSPSWAAVDHEAVEERFPGLLDSVLTAEASRAAAR